MPDYIQLLDRIKELVEEKKSIIPPMQEILKNAENEELKKKVKRFIEINEELSELTKQLGTVFEHKGTFYSVEIKEDGIVIEVQDEWYDDEVTLPYPVLYKLLAWLRKMGVLEEADA